MADYINDIIDAVMDMAEATEPYAAIVRGPLPPDNGIAIYMANGTPNATFLNKRIVYDFVLTLNGSTPGSRPYRRPSTLSIRR